MAYPTLNLLVIPLLFVITIVPCITISLLSTISELSQHFKHITVSFRAKLISCSYTTVCIIVMASITQFLQYVNMKEYNVVYTDYSKNANDIRESLDELFAQAKADGAEIDQLQSLDTVIASLVRSFGDLLTLGFSRAESAGVKIDTNGLSFEIKGGKGIWAESQDYESSMVRLDRKQAYLAEKIGFRLQRLKEVTDEFIEKANILVGPNAIKSPKWHFWALIYTMSFIGGICYSSSKGYIRFEPSKEPKESG